MLRGWTTATGGSERSYPLCPPLSTAIHRKEKVAKRKEERPTTAFFFSSNDDGNDHLKSGQLWSEGLGAPQALDPAAGWRESDIMPLDIIGGREGGFRADTMKSHCQPGRWRVRVETSDQRELGRIDLTVIEDDSAAAPPTHTVLR